VQKITYTKFTFTPPMGHFIQYIRIPKVGVVKLYKAKH